MERRDRDDWSVAEETHKFEEWEKNNPGERRSKPIPLEDVLDAIGRSDDKERILAELQDDDTLDRILGEKG